MNLSSAEINPNIQRRNRAKRLLENGRPDDALALLRENIKTSPRDAESVYLSGVCLARSGDYTAAEKAFSRAVKLDKNLFQAYSDLGLSQSRQGKYSQAIKSFKASLAKNPRFAPAHSHLAFAYLQTQQAPKALKHAKESVTIGGDNPGFLNIQGLCYRDAGQTDKAIQTFEKICSTYPGFYGALHSLYETYRLIDDMPNAEKALLRAKGAFANDASVYLTLGRFYEQTGRTEDAKDLYKEGLNLCVDNIDLLIALGRANRLLGLVGEGIKHINKALDTDSKHQPALAERSAFHILQGDYDDAYILLRSYISSNPNQPLTSGLATAYAHVCRLIGRHEESIKALLSAIKGPGVSDEMQSVMHFSLGDSYDKLEKYDRAFTMYCKANDTPRESDIDRYLGIMSDIGSTICAENPDKTTRSDSSISKPVFIVGMPRSGTSLAEQILASHPEVYGAGEITELWNIGQDICKSPYLENYSAKLSSITQDSLNRYAKRYLTYIENLDSSASHITDKLPHNFMHIGLIKRLFPGARIIHCHRHPFDTCLSIYFKKFNSDHVYARKLSDIARFYSGYKALMDLCQNTYTGIFNLKYEDLVNDQEKLSRDIIGHIGLEWDDKCLRYYETDRLVYTPSYTQANKPIYAGSVSRWKHYRSHLQPLIDILGEPEQYG